MLKQEQAEKELEKVRIAKWKETRLREVAKLPANLVRIGRFLLDRDPVTGKDFTNWQKRGEYLQVIPGEATQLRPAERKRLFLTLFPHLGEYLEEAWQLCARLPYEIDYDRKGFRAPGDEQVVQESRWRFLAEILDELEGYDPTPAWLAAWAPYLSGGSGADAVGLVLAATIDHGGPQGEEVFQTLLGSINRTHPIGGMGRHVIRGLLVAGKPEGWEAVEKLLLAAQRQEGLRQTILETVDEAHPEAFRRMLALILEHDLLRFSATVRAAMIWFGIGEQVDESGSRFKKAFASILKYMAEPDACREAIAKASGDELYFALWSAAYADAVQAVPLAVPLLSDKSVERRYLTVLFLDAVGLPSARQALVAAMEDADLRVALRAFEAIRYVDRPEGDSSLFEPLTRLLARMPEKATQLKKIGPDDEELEADPQEVADLLPDELGSRNLEELLVHLPRMSGSGRADVVRKVAEMKPLTEKGREVLFRFIGDRDGWVRGAALDGLKKLSLQPEEAGLVEALLTRKSSDVREQVLKLLVKQKGEAALASADRLLAAKNANQRQAGLELLRKLTEGKKSVAACRERARAYQEAHPHVTEVEQSHLDAILDVHREVPTLSNALGLLDRTQLTPIQPPQKRSVQILTSAARAIVTELDKFVTQHAETIVHLDGESDSFEEPEEVPEGSEDDDPRQMPLGSITYELPVPHWGDPREKDLKRMPLREELTKWWNDRPAKMRDADGLELARAAVLSRMDDYLFNYPGGNKKSPELQKAMKVVLGGLEKPIKLKHEVVGELLAWLLRLDEPAGATDWMLDVLEATLAQIPQEILTPKKKKQQYDDDWRTWNIFEFWPERVQDQWDNHGGDWTAEQKARYIHLLRWMGQPTPQAMRRSMPWETITQGYELGLMNLFDLTEQFLCEPDGNDYLNSDFNALEEATRRPEPPFLTQHPEVRDLVERCRQRVLEVELARGDLPTAATPAAQALESVIGLDTLCRILTALGPRNLKGNQYGDSKADIFTGLLRKCYPGPDDTPEVFAARMKELIKQKAILPALPLQLAFLNPRWVEHVAHFLSLPGLSEAVWWFHAHMQYANPELPESLEAELNRTQGDHPNAITAWDYLVQQRTTLSEEDRDEGAVDSEWFHRVYSQFPPKRWDDLMEASKYANGNHKNAQKLANVLRGKAKKAELIREVRQRKLKESVRLIGLLPLAVGEKREADLHQRWKALAEYRKYARSLSPLSREDAIRAGEIGLANLARTAGYNDPNRLIWAMEWNEIQDLAAGPVVATVGDVTVSLALDDQANPVTTVQRGDRVLKAIPPKVRKDKKVAAIVDRRGALKQQASRIRQSLEAMMIRGDTFHGEELPQLMKHPLLAKNLSRLVVLGEGIRGYPIAGGKALEDCHGKQEPVKKDEVLRLAHAFDLLEGKDWHDWQAHCFRIERVQPFKQIFRELYLLTDAERADRTFSRRYSGQQVNANQAMALFGTRGWRTSGGVTKTFSDQNLVAEVSFQYGVGTPLEVEGLTLDRLQFHRRGEWEARPLAEVPHRLLSEVLRDLDLVVSVAHVGGVDPEASASTMEMRAALAMELVDLLGLKNVQRKPAHLLIDGTLGKYSLHLGSGTVHKMPGGAVCIVSVPAQHRGRIFLPFADDDPRTAEVLAKLLLLARDDEIQDPGILDQLRR